MATHAEPAIATAVGVTQPCAPQPVSAARDTSDGRRIYLKCLTWAFTVLNSVRVVAYLPTLSAIIGQADSSQHSLWTWLTFCGANVTMAAWLYEQNGQREHRAVVVNTSNAVMCMLITVVIILYRI